MDSVQDLPQLTRDVLRISVPLHQAIAELDEAGARYELAGPPGLALFRRADGADLTHVSGTPSPSVMPLLDDLRERHLAEAGVRGDNSHVQPLLLACLYLADEASRERLQLGGLARRPASIDLLDEEAGRHDPELAPHDAALRAWAPLAAAHAPQAGVHPAILQLHFHSGRSARYVPWTP